MRRDIVVGIEQLKNILIDIRIGNSLLLGHYPFGLEVTLSFKGTEASWEGTKATFHSSPGAPMSV